MRITVEFEETTRAYVLPKGATVGHLKWAILAQDKHIEPREDVSIAVAVYSSKLEFSRIDMLLFEATNSLRDLHLLLCQHLGVRRHLAYFPAILGASGRVDLAASARQIEALHYDSPIGEIAEQCPRSADGHYSIYVESRLFCSRPNATTCLDSMDAAAAKICCPGGTFTDEIRYYSVDTSIRNLYLYRGSQCLPNGAELESGMTLRLE